MYTKHVTYQIRIFSFYNYSRTPLVCFICIKQTVTVASLYFSSTTLGWNNTDKMIHANYYICVGLLDVRDVSVNVLEKVPSSQGIYKTLEIY